MHRIRDFLGVSGGSSSLSSFGDQTTSTTPLLRAFQLRAFQSEDDPPSGPPSGSPGYSPPSVTIMPDKWVTNPASVGLPALQKKEAETFCGELVEECICSWSVDLIKLTEGLKQEREGVLEGQPVSNFLLKEEIKNIIEQRLSGFTPASTPCFKFNNESDLSMITPVNLFERFRTSRLEASLDSEANRDEFNEAIRCLLENRAPRCYIRLFGKFIDDDVVNKLATSCSTIEGPPLEIDLGGCSQITDQAVLALLNNCNNLWWVGLTGCGNITSGIVLEAKGECLSLASNGFEVHFSKNEDNKITELDLSVKEEVSDQAFKKLLEECTDLKEVCLGGYKELSKETIETLIRKNSQLKYIKIADCLGNCCTSITDKDVMDLAKQGKDGLCIKTAFYGVKKIEGGLHLNIYYDGIGLTDARVRELAGHCNGITSVSCACADLITDEAVKALAKSCPNLTSIDLSYCTKITDAGVQALAENCPNLNQICLAGCTRITD